MRWHYLAGIHLRGLFSLSKRPAWTSFRFGTTLQLKSTFLTVLTAVCNHSRNRRQDAHRLSLPSLAVQIPLGASGPFREVSCWEFAGPAYDQGDEAAEWLTKYLEQPARLVRYAGIEAAPDRSSMQHVMKFFCCHAVSLSMAQRLRWLLYSMTCHMNNQACCLGSQNAYQQRADPCAYTIEAI